MKKPKSGDWITAYFPYIGLCAKRIKCWEDDKTCVFTDNSILYWHDMIGFSSSQ